MVGTKRSSVPGILSDGDLMGPGFPQEVLVLLAAHEGHDAGAGEPGQLHPEVARPSGGPVTSMLRPSRPPPFSRAYSAVRPATGSVAACPNGTFSGSSAREFVGTVTSSAQAAEGRRPTTRAPAGGPVSLAASRSTVPARSQPGLKPGSAAWARRTSPRFSEIDETRTSASEGAGDGFSISPRDRFAGALLSTRTARI